MSGVTELLCVGLKRSVASMLPWDIPWYDPSHTVFFLALYGALGVIGLGMATAAVMTYLKLTKGDQEGHH
ncbi:MAG TPA: hypothetical protein PLM79_18305 [Syntrophobacteraceae bacterium]|nr:hypothetical protein [Syntrophobacteraceae bacterium]